MEVLKLIQRNNLEKLGKFFLKKGTEFCVKKEFSISYEYFKQGLDILTCDCNDGWKNEYKRENEDVFYSPLIEGLPLKQYLFVKAYVFSFEDSLKKLYVALDSIDKYLEYSPDQYGFYVKGKILLSLNEGKGALVEFINAQKIQNSHRLEYRIGRTNFQFLNKNGLHELYLSFCKNPSSNCCLKYLKKNSISENVSFVLHTKCDNPLLTSFLINKNENYFISQYFDFINNESEYSNNQTNNYLNEFIDFLKSNSNLFIEKKLIQIEYIPEENFHTEQENISKINDSNILIALELVEIEKEYKLNNYEESEGEEDFYYDDDESSNAYNSPYYNDNLDLDQQSPEFWDSL